MASTSPPPVAAPAAYVSTHAIAFGAIGDAATAVEPAHPLPVSDRAYVGAVAIMPDVPGIPGRALAIDCSRGGRVTLVLADASQLSVSVAAGLSILPFAVSTVLSSGMTAAASFASLN